MGEEPARRVLLSSTRLTSTPSTCRVWRQRSESLSAVRLRPSIAHNIVELTLLAVQAAIVGGATILVAVLIWQGERLRKLGGPVHFAQHH